MEFGRVQDLAEIDFSLPPDTESTKNTLQQNRNAGPLQVHVGAPKWGEKNWKGIIYPKKAPDNQLLKLYSQNFNAVEFGPTFYNLYNADEIDRWTAQVAGSPDFKFCPKFPQMISHIRRLANAEKQTAEFHQSLKGFGNHLGPLLLQLSDNFSPKSFPYLKSYLESWDPAIRLSVEVRNHNWFADTHARKDLFDLLAGLHIGTVITDSSGRRDCVHMELTTTDAFVRFVGNNLDASDYRRMDDWVERVAAWHKLGLESLWFFMHQNNERFVPEACSYFIRQLNKKLGLSVKLPKFVPEI